MNYCTTYMMSTINMSVTMSTCTIKMIWVYIQMSQENTVYMLSLFDEFFVLSVKRKLFYNRFYEVPHIFHKNKRMQLFSKMAPEMILIPSVSG